MIQKKADGTIKIAVDLDSSQLEQALGDRERAEDVTKSDDLHPLTEQGKDGKIEEN